MKFAGLYIRDGEDTPAEVAFYQDFKSGDVAPLTEELALQMIARLTAALQHFRK